MLLASEDFCGCVSRCYYAVYQAMWAAVGESEKKPRREHFGLILIEIYEWFTEGLDTKDLQEAKALINELRH